jgi:hypothetical protein
VGAALGVTVADIGIGIGITAADSVIVSVIVAVLVAGIVAPRQRRQRRLQLLCDARHGIGELGERVAAGGVGHDERWAEERDGRSRAGGAGGEPGEELVDV